jgi:uncharacterized protein YxeA
MKKLFYLISLILVACSSTNVREEARKETNPFVTELNQYIDANEMIRQENEMLSTADDEVTETVEGEKKSEDLL